MKKICANCLFYETKNLIDENNQPKVKAVCFHDASPFMGQSVGKGFTCDYHVVAILNKPLMKSLEKKKVGLVFTKSDEGERFDDLESLEKKHKKNLAALRVFKILKEWKL